MEPFVNMWALLGAMIFSVLLGFVWYGPLFGKQWMKLSGIKMPEKNPGFSTMVKPMLLSFIGAIMMAFALSSVLAFHNAFYATSGYSSALALAFFLWLGFIVPVYLNLTGWEGKSWTLFAINAGYWLVFLAAAAKLIVFFA